MNIIVFLSSFIVGSAVTYVIMRIYKNKKHRSKTEWLRRYNWIGIMRKSGKREGFYPCCVTVLEDRLTIQYGYTFIGFKIEKYGDDYIILSNDFSKYYAVIMPDSVSISDSTGEFIYILENK